MKKGVFQKYIKQRNSIFVFFEILFLFFVVLIAPVCNSETISDWVVAFIDDEAITHSELQEQYWKTLKVTPEITIDEVLDTMINRVLILREAKRYRLEGPSPEEVIKEYIDLKVRAFIRVPEAEIENFYKENSGRFSGRKYDDVLDEIEQYLIEKELNARLKETLRELRKTAYIKILNKQEQ